MAENKIEILVTSKNDTKAGFESAKRDAEKAGDEAGQGFASKFASWIGGTGGKGLSESLGNLPYVGGLLGQTGIYGLAAVIPAAAALLVEVDALATGFAAASAGLGAFALFAIPTFKQVASDASGLVSQYDALQTAQNKLAIAQANFNADPTKQNKALLASAQRAAQAAQITVQAAEMGIGQDAGAAAVGVLQLRDAYDKLSTALQPLTYKVLADALTAVTNLLPDLKPFAEAGGKALDGLLQKVNAFFGSADFKKWLDKFLPYVGPSITAIGTGIGKLIIAVGQLFTILSKKDVITGINIAFGALATTIQIIALAIEALKTTWDLTWHAIEQTFLTSGLEILTLANDYFGWIPGLGPQLQKALDDFNHWAYGVEGDLNGVGTAAQNAWSSIIGAVDAVANALNPSGGTGPGSGKLGVLSGSRATGGVQAAVHLTVTPGGSALDNMFVEWLKSSVRVRGGGGPRSVQIALGQTH